MVWRGTEEMLISFDLWLLQQRLLDLGYLPGKQWMYHNLGLFYPDGDFLRQALLCSLFRRENQGSKTRQDTRWLSVSLELYLNEPQLTSKSKLFTQTYIGLQQNCGMTRARTSLRHCRPLPLCCGPVIVQWASILPPWPGSEHNLSAWKAAHSHPTPITGAGVGSEPSVACSL